MPPQPHRLPRTPASRRRPRDLLFFSAIIGTISECPLANRFLPSAANSPPAHQTGRERKLSPKTLPKVPVAVSHSLSLSHTLYSGVFLYTRFAYCAYCAKRMSLLGLCCFLCYRDLFHDLLAIFHSSLLTLTPWLLLILSLFCTALHSIFRLLPNDVRFCAVGVNVVSLHTLIHRTARFQTVFFCLASLGSLSCNGTQA